MLDDENSVTDPDDQEVTAPPMLPSGAGNGDPVLTGLNELDHDERPAGCICVIPSDGCKSCLGGCPKKAEHGESSDVT